MSSREKYEKEKETKKKKKIGSAVAGAVLALGSFAGVVVKAFLDQKNKKS